MMSSSLDGPYTSPADDFLVGNDRGARCATTGRVIPYQDTNFFLHFSIARRPVLGTPKIVRLRPDGTLYLEYMPVLEKLETAVLCDSIENIPESESPDSGQWRRAGASFSVM